MSGTSTQAANPGQTGGTGQVLSIIDLAWNGTLLTIKEGAKLKLGGLKNKAVMSTRGVYNAQSMEMSEITATVLIQPGQSITGTFGNAAGELQASCDTGQTFVWDSAFVVGATELTGKADDGLAVKWGGGAPTEI